MEEHLEPEFDFNMLDEYDLNQVSEEEIEQAYRSENVHVDDVPGFPVEHFRYIVVGFSSRMKPVLMIIDYQTDKVRVQMVCIASEFDIKNFWCKNSKKRKL